MMRSATSTSRLLFGEIERRAESEAQILRVAAGFIRQFSCAEYVAYSHSLMKDGGNVLQREGVTINGIMYKIMKLTPEVLFIAVRER
jgi:hypothetical protein